MIQCPIYQGRPTVYIDHTILDFFVENGIDSFGEKLTEYYQVVYKNKRQRR